MTGRPAPYCGHRPSWDTCPVSRPASGPGSVIGPFPGTGSVIGPRLRTGSRKDHP